MNKDAITEVKKKLLDMNKTIASLDPAIRTSAFEILAPYYFDTYEAPDGGTKDEEIHKKKKVAHTGTMTKFFGEHEHSKPKDNVFLIAAWIYSQHGAVPITTKICQDISAEAEIIIPNRPDNTMWQAKNKGKNIFRQQGNGWKPTTHGELYLKNTYGVRKGNKPLEPEEDK